MRHRFGGMRQIVEWRDEVAAQEPSAEGAGDYDDERDDEHSEKEGVRTREDIALRARDPDQPRRAGDRRERADPGRSVRPRRRGNAGDLLAARAVDAFVEVSPDVAAHVADEENCLAADQARENLFRLRRRHARQLTHESQRVVLVVENRKADIREDRVVPNGERRHDGRRRQQDGLIAGDGARCEHARAVGIPQLDREHRCSTGALLELCTRRRLGGRIRGDEHRPECAVARQWGAFSPEPGRLGEHRRQLPRNVQQVIARGFHDRALHFAVGRSHDQGDGDRKEHGGEQRQPAADVLPVAHLVQTAHRCTS